MGDYKEPQHVMLTPVERSRGLENAEPGVRRLGTQIEPSDREARVADVRPVVATGVMRPDTSNASIDDRSDRYAVIGAGSSGLAALKRLREYGLDAECLEREGDLGGNWNIDLPVSRVCESTHLISSKRQTEYLDHPMPADWPEYPSHRQALAYFRSYVDRFALAGHLEFGAGVRRATPIDYTGERPGWRVELESGAVRRYRGLVVANGHNWDPIYPDWSGPALRSAGAESPFGGVELHAGFYRTPDVLRGKRVLVVGGGNSGCDLAVESSQHADVTRLSLRRGYHFLPKFYRGRPIDEVGERLLRWRVPLAVRRLLARAMAYVLLGPRETAGLPEPDHRLFETHPTINSQLVYRLRHGELAVRPDVEALTQSGVRFRDGAEEAFDVIVYATGYRLSFPFLDPADLNWDRLKGAGGKPRLFLNAFHPTRRDLFVVGMIQPDSGQWGLVDRQSRLIAAYLTACAKERSAARAVRAFDRERARPARRDSIAYVDSPRHLLEVEHFGYARTLDRHWRRLSRGVNAGAATPSRSTKTAAS